MDKLSPEGRVVIAAVAVFTFIATLVFAFVFALAIIGVNLSPFPITAVVASAALAFVTWQTRKINDYTITFSVITTIVLAIAALGWASNIEVAEFVYISCLLQITAHMVLAFASVLGFMPKPQVEKAPKTKKATV